MKTTKSFRSLSLAVLASAALVLSACGSGDGSSDGVNQEQPIDDDSVATAEATESPAAESGDDSATASVQADGKGGSLDDARSAIETAEAEEDGTAFHIDYDDDGHWEIDVAAGDREWEYQIREDGSTIDDSEEDDLDSDDRSEIDAADVTLLEALEAALEDTPGTIDDAELDDEDGTLRWEVEIYVDGSDDTREVLIDAASGDVIN